MPRCSEPPTRVRSVQAPFFPHIVLSNVRGEGGLTVAMRTAGGEANSVPWGCSICWVALLELWRVSGLEKLARPVGHPLRLVWFPWFCRG